MIKKLNFFEVGRSPPVLYDSLIEKQRPAMRLKSGKKTISNKQKKLSTMNIKVRNQFDKRPVDKGEKNTKPSITVPDQAMSINEILVKHSRGIPTTGERIPIYENPNDFDDVIPDFRRLDLAEKQQVKELVKQEIDEIKQKYKERQDAEGLQPKPGQTLEGNNNSTTDTQSATGTNVPV